MRNRLLILLGAALLVSSILGYFIPQKKYLLIKGNYQLELSKDQYAKFYYTPNSRYVSEQSNVNFPLMIVSFMGVLGMGLLISVISNKNILYSDFENNHINNDLDKMKLKGYVKTIKGRQWYIQNQNYSKWKVTQRFNRIGYLMFEHNAAARHITYNSANQIIEENFYDENPNVPICRKTYVYNVAGQIIEIKNYDSSNKLTEILNSLYDDMGMLIEEHGHKPNGKLWIKRVFSHRNNNTVSVFYDSDGIPFERREYKYDSFGNIIETKLYKGELLKSISYFELHYDKRLNIIESKSVSSEGSILSTTQFNYTFDLMGNWVKQFVDKNPIEIKARQIEYYWFNWITNIFIIIKEFTISK